ncbi:MAG: 4Fe-4S ferredoxin, partial [Clostridiales bacterium]|nr:4Fe-4S ferredoxin [Clostridiales bacterium]
MEKAKVFFTDFRTVGADVSLPKKLQRLMRRADIGNIDMEGKFVAIKMHFGELGNLGYLRPNYARA